MMKERKNVVSEVVETENEKCVKKYLEKYESLEEIERKCLCSIIGMVIEDQERSKALWTVLYAQTTRKYQVHEIERVIDKAIEKILKEEPEMKEKFCKVSRATTKVIIEFLAKEVIRS